MHSTPDVPTSFCSLIIFSSFRVAFEQNLILSHGVPFFTRVALFCVCVCYLFLLCCAADDFSDAISQHAGVTRSQHQLAIHAPVGQSEVVKPALRRRHRWMGVL